MHIGICVYILFVCACIFIQIVYSSSYFVFLIYIGNCFTPPRVELPHSFCLDVNGVFLSSSCLGFLVSEIGVQYRTTDGVKKIT